MDFRFRRLRTLIATSINPNTPTNKFNEAFLWGVGGGYTAYDDKGTTYIEDGYNINPLVYSIVNQMATKTSSIPYYIKKVEDKDALKKLRRLELSTSNNLTPQQKVQHLILESKAFSKNEMPFPMDAPNPNQTWTEWIALYKTFLKLTGNVYIYILAPEDGANKGKPLSVYLLPSQNTQIIVKKNADMLSVESPIQGYILVQGRQFIEFEAENVIHIKYPNPNYGDNGEHLYGMSPLRSALKNIQSSNTGLDLNIKTLKSGGAFGFIHANKTPLTVDQAKEIKERLLEMNNSPEDLSKIAAVSTDLSFTRMSLTSDELKPFDYLEFDEKMIASVLGWEITDGNRGDFGGTIAEIRKQRITDNIKPDLDLLSNALNKWFLPRFKGFDNTEIIFDIMELPEMQTDSKELSTWLYNGLDKGVFQRNEIRLALNYLEVENDAMERFTVASDVISLEEAIDNDFNVSDGNKE